MDRKELVLELFELGVVKFGSFTLKSGLQSPFYLDFRRIVGYPSILKAISEQLWNLTEKLEFDHLCGVPYAALSIASTMSVTYDKPMIVKRKEQKKHGTKRLVEGVYVNAQKCVVIDDVISSGISMIETLEALEEEGLVMKDVLAIVDRQQGGVPTLEKHGYNVHCVYTVEEILDILYEHHKISSQIRKDTLKFIQTNSINFEELRKLRAKKPIWSYDYIRSESRHPTSYRLLTIMKEKQTNLCCSADVTTQEKLLELADAVGPHICMLKTHIDNLSDFDETVPAKLRAIAKKHQFLILEDRKFADIGHIVMQQFTSAPLRISEWADAVTVHVVAGSSSVQALRDTNKLSTVGVILIVEMSTSDTLTSKNYAKKALAIAEQHKDVVLGIVAQNYRPERPEHMLFTPGINISAKGDKHGQTYNHPKKAFIERGVDVMIVGRGIYKAKNPATKAAEYQKIGWENYLKRLKV